MRITVLAPESPFPPLHGGQVDVWERLLGLRSLDVSVQLVYWSAEAPTEPAPELAAVVSDIIVVPERRWRSPLLLMRMPPRAARHWLGAAAIREIAPKVLSFRPDVLLVESWYVGPPGLQLARNLGTPFVYRSQNVESEYLRGQVAKARGLQRLRIGSNLLRIGALEAQLRDSALRVWDICEEDAADFLSLGIPGRTFVLPPLAPNGVVWESDAPTFDAGFVGNLWAPNNIDGVAWLLGAVRPRLQQQLGREPRLLVAGSRPSPVVRRLVEEAGAELAADPADVAPWERRCAVLVNPVLHSSGVNLKMLRMLTVPRNVVSTSAGARGLPRALREFIRIANDPATFADAVVQATNPLPPEEFRRRITVLDESCGVGRLKAAIRDLASALAGEGTRNATGKSPNG